MAAGGQQRIALGRLVRHLAGDASPHHADLLDAEIVVNADMKHELLGVEHDAAAGQVVAGQLRRFVVQRRDGHLERLLAGSGRTRPATGA